MSTTQDNVMQALGLELVNRKLELVDDRSMANTGRIYATGNSLDAVGPTLAYNFQKDYITFKLTNQVTHRASWWANGASGTARSLSELVQQVADELEGIAP